MNKIIIMDKGSEAGKFVEELVYENIKLMMENARLTYEVERLRERVEDIERFYRVFGLSCLMKDSSDKFVVLAERLRHYKN
jgi:regulator of replication initiation timing